MNADFANLSGSSYTVSANMEIQFCLAVISESGLPMTEPGIERIDRDTMGWTAPPYSIGTYGYLDNTIMPATIWDPYRFYNVCTTEISTIVIPGQVVLGVATFPVTAGSLPGLLAGETDTHCGVIIDYSTVGSHSSPGSGGSYGQGKTLTHETGHFFRSQAYLG